MSLFFKCKPWLLLIFIFVNFQTAFANEITPTGKITAIADAKFIYKAQYQGLNLGEIEITFKKQDEFKVDDYPFNTEFLKDFYLYSLVFKPQGMADLFVDSWVSHHWLSVYKNQLVNLSYFSNYKGFPKDKTVKVYSDLMNEKSKNMDTGKIFETPFPSLNNYTVFLSLAFDLLAQPNPANNQRFSYSTSSNDDSKTRGLIYRNREKIKVNDQEFYTLVFTTTDNKSETQFWLSKDLFFLPVKVRSTRKNNDVTIELVSAEFVK